MSAKPYWSSPDGAIVLHLGDCREVMARMAADSVASVICDPPYSDHVHANVRRVDVNAKGVLTDARVVDLHFASLSAELRQACALAFARVTSRWTLIFGDVESAHTWREAVLAAGLDYVRTGAWVRAGAPQITGDRPAVGFEAITIAHRKGAKKWSGGGHAAVWSYPTSHLAGEHRIHPTQKPIRLMRRLVELFTDPGELVLDPFAGSGTTLAACMERGRRCIGVELDEANAEKAAVRLEQMTKQGDLFAKAGT